MKLIYTVFLIIICSLTRCGIGAGTLGGFPTIYFPTSKMNLEHAMDTLYNEYPQYRIPEKWREKDNWSKRGYDFLESRMFYFQNPPEEMYYVTFIGDAEMLKDPNKIGIAIRAITDGNSRWLKYDELSEPKREQVARRFKNEIILKLEKYTGSKSFGEE